MTKEDPGSSANELPRFDRHFFNGEQKFTCIGGGSIGGKAQGLAIMRNRLAQYFPPSPDAKINVTIPTLTVVATDLFEEFMELNKLHEIAYSDMRDDQIAHAFQKAQFPPQMVGDLRALIDQVHTPLAVRSSSYLEDAMYQPFASVYTTKMLPNNQHDPDIRFRKLTEAIKYVYASTFFRDAKNYIQATEHTTSDEKMAVVIQEVVGDRYGDRFYPHISGVARSYNYYPVGKSRPEEGVVDLALGLGKSIVDEAQAWAYSPARPRTNPPFNSPADLLKQTQTKFWAVNMGKAPEYDPIHDTEYLVRFSLAAAEQDRTLDFLVSTYNAQDDRIEIGAGTPGPRILTFAPLLVYNQVPLNDLLKQLIKAGEDEVGQPVEIEFAVTLNREHGFPARFGFLQVRPMVISEEEIDFDPAEMDGPQVLLAAEHVLGNGKIDSIRDVVYVKPEVFSAMRTREIVPQIERFNRELLKEKRPYLLIGFGRWGSSDPSLGIPVNFGQISGAKVIVETTLPEMYVTLSQGSHFFHNITSFKIMYFSVLHSDRHKINWEWLARQTARGETEYLRWINMDSPLQVKVDGRQGRGVIRL